MVGWKGHFVYQVLAIFYEPNGVSVQRLVAKNDHFQRLPFFKVTISIKNDSKNVNNINMRVNNIDILWVILLILLSIT